MFNDVALSHWIHISLSFELWLISSWKTKTCRFANRPSNLDNGVVANMLLCHLSGGERNKKTCWTPNRSPLCSQMSWNFIVFLDFHQFYFRQQTRRLSLITVIVSSFGELFRIRIVNFPVTSERERENDKLSIKAPPQQKKIFYGWETFFFPFTFSYVLGWWQWYFHSSSYSRSIAPLNR